MRNSSSKKSSVTVRKVVSSPPKSTGVKRGNKVVGGPKSAASGSIRGQKGAAKSTGYTFPGKAGGSRRASGMGGGSSRGKQLPHLNRPKKS